MSTASAAGCPYNTQNYNDVYSEFMNSKSAPQKIGLALSGGSTYGVAHIGVLVALAQAKVPIDCISGTSAGSLVAACFAFGMSPEDMVGLTTHLNWKKFSRFAYSKLGLRTNKPMAAFLTDTLGDVNIEDAGIPLAVVATNIETHKMVIIRKGPLQDAVRASTCIPGFFTPVEINGELLVDGGLTENVPLTALDEMGATVKIAVNLLGSSEHTRPKNVFDVLSRSVDILSLHRDQHLAHTADVLIEPNLAAFNAMSFKEMESIFGAGYEAGLRAIPKINALLNLEKQSPLSALAKFFSKLGV